MRFQVECLECGRKFRTASMVPSCPKCGGSDVEPTEPTWKVREQEERHV